MTNNILRTVSLKLFSSTLLCSIYALRQPKKYIDTSYVASAEVGAFNLQAVLRFNTIAVDGTAIGMLQC